MSIDLKQIGKALYEGTPKQRAILHLDDHQQSTGLAQVLPDRVRFYPTIHASIPAFRQEPISLTFLDTPHAIHVQMSRDFDGQHTDKVWHFYEFP